VEVPSWVAEVTDIVTLITLVAAPIVWLAKIMIKMNTLISVLNVKIDSVKKDVESQLKEHRELFYNLTKGGDSRD